MPSTPTPGPDLDAAATHGGAGWLARTATHAEEIAAGELWSPYSVRSEVAPLQAVLLSWPGEELALDGDPDEQLMLEPVDVPAIQAQAEGLQAAYESAGVRVHLFRPDTPPPPNLIFMRDLFFMTPEGAILARPAALQRAGEERFAARALTAAGVPILGTAAERIDAAEDRHRFSSLCDRAGIAQPAWTEYTGEQDLDRDADQVGYPVLVRPSYVLSGAAMAVAEGQGAEPALFDVNLLVEHGRLNVGPAIWPDAANMAAEAEPDLILLETWTGTLHNTLLLARSLRQRLP